MWRVLPVLAIGLSGCVDTSVDRVLLDARIDAVDIAVEQTALVTVLSGTFELELELGDLAESASLVERAPSITLVREEDQSFVRVLDALPVGAGFPATVEPGSTETIELVLTDENTLASDQFDAICGAGSLAIVGSVQDAASGETTAFSSEAFTPSGCD